MYSFKGALLINTFAYLDKILMESLKKCYHVFESCPHDHPELANSFYDSITRTNMPNLNLNKMKKK